jgi:hypothetical protein
MAAARVLEIAGQIKLLADREIGGRRPGSSGGLVVLLEGEQTLASPRSPEWGTKWVVLGARLNKKLA